MSIDNFDVSPLYLLPQILKILHFRLVCSIGTRLDACFLFCCFCCWFNGFNLGALWGISALA